MNLHLGNSPRVESRSLVNLFNIKERDKNKNDLMDAVHEFVKGELSDVKNNQLRNLLDLVIAVKQSHKGLKNAVLQPDSIGKLAILRPRIAYMAARQIKLKKIEQAFNLILTQPDNFKTGKDLDDLYDLASAIVAYHKYNEEINKEINKEQKKNKY